MHAMLDSDTCIHIMKHDPRMRPRIPVGDCGISQIVLGELEYGVRNSLSNRQQSNRQSLLDFLSLIRILPLTNELAGIYGGTPIGPNDLWIAAHALAAGAILVTNNTGEFSRVADLAIDTWMAE